jgi:dihydrofolate reductase
VARGARARDPPFQHPVFVLTHHERPLLEKQGGTSFTFITDGVSPALERAKQAADGKDVALAGGAEAIQQYLVAGLVDELSLHVVPVLLGDGERLFEGLGMADVSLEQVEAVDAPGVAHLKYRASA